ncbi:MAG: hypothetical protein ACI8P9_001971 [Parasphingorhabdus sp.]|jgi:hypothetical protein
MKVFLHSWITALLFTPLLGMADALPIKAGLWEITSTTTNTFTGSNTQTNRECIRENEFDPQKLLQDAQGCKVADSKLKRKTLTFTMQCDIQGVQGSVDGVFKTRGSEAEGTMLIKMDMGGMELKLDSSWNGQRIGGC